MREEKPDAAPPVVLVVEDEAMLRLAAADMLEEKGYSVIEAASAVDALKVLETRADVGVVFTDNEMPGKLKGMDLARLVHDHWPNVLLVITSGGPKPDGPDDGHFIPKPYTPDQVTAEIADLLHKK
jgi:CheY-like chemotaxis protein